MKKTLIFTLAVLFLSSCASVFNQPSQTIYITTSTPANVIINKDTIETFKYQTPVRVKRQPADLKIKVFNDSVNKEFTIKHENSWLYWLNAYPTPLLWTGFLIDRNNPKRYAYPSRIYFDMSDRTDSYMPYYHRTACKKGDMDLQISIPYINSFLLRPDYETGYKSNTGFWGLTLGIDYYQSPTQYINLSVSGVTDFFLPFPAAVDFSGYYELMTSGYLSVSNNYKINDFIIGYGLSYSRNTWDLKYSEWCQTEPPSREPVKKTNNAIGFVFPMYYLLDDDFYIGAVYRPSLFRLSNVNSFKYEHLISIDFGWKIRFKK